jgi:hypothetical protein
MMVLALALLIAAAVVSATLRSEPEQLGSRGYQKIPWRSTAVLLRGGRECD